VKTETPHNGEELTTSSRVQRHHRNAPFGVGDERKFGRAFSAQPEMGYLT
jgi:hypothetical protein